MTDEFEQQGWVKIGVAGALARQYAADQRDLLGTAAAMLEQALPGETEVGLRGGLFAKKTISKVTVTFGGDRYTLEDQGRSVLRATRIQVVRGIALKTEEIPVELWLAEVGAKLEERARVSASARAALEAFLS